MQAIASTYIFLHHGVRAGISTWPHFHSVLYLGWELESYLAKAKLKVNKNKGK